MRLLVYVQFFHSGYLLQWISHLKFDFVVFFFFFFQAEDGIRDGTVTGVQTCALPILLRLQRGPVDDEPVERRLERLEAVAPRREGADVLAVPEEVGIDLGHPDGQARSEERRVGKECRSRGSPEH